MQIFCVGQFMLNHLRNKRRRNDMTDDKDRGKRIAIMAIKENTPKNVELEILNLVSQGYTLADLRKAGYTHHLAS